MANQPGRAIRFLYERGPLELLEKIAHTIEFRTRKLYLKNIAPNHGMLATRDKFGDLAHSIEQEDPTIVDGGAYKGSTIEEMIENFRNPTIYAFEPIPHLYRKLKKEYRGNSNVHIHQIALGDSSTTIDYNVVNNEHSSSVLAPTEQKKEYHGGGVEVSETIEVEQTRLDEFFNDPPNAIKLDLQGYELKALEGSTGWLEDVSTILTEVEFIELYEGQPLFQEVESFMEGYGFSLFNFYELYTEPNGQLAWGDAIFKNR